jgi:hypothetical protein
MSAFETAISMFDAENARDPNTELSMGAPVARELLYAQWLTAWVLKLAPEASEPLRLAARCQHICRWMVPRDTYPMTRPGYLRWRNDLKQFHARKSEAILREAGYGDAMIDMVRDLNLKKNFPQDPDSRILEDALCLVFLEHQLGDLAQKTTDEKLLNAVKKSWEKMTEAARQHALALALDPLEKRIIERALQGG